MTLRMTVIGTGYLGATHAACMAELGYDVARRRRRSRQDRALSRPGRVPFFEPGLPNEILRAQPRPRAGCASRPATPRPRSSATCTSSASAPRRRRASYAADLTAPGRRRSTGWPRCSPGRRAGRGQVDGAGRHRRPAGGAARRAGPGGRRRRAGRGTPSSCARASPSRTPCTRTGSSFGRARLRAGRGAAARGLRADARRRHPVRRHRLSPPPSWSRSSANAFLATKISFINAMAEVCEATGADVTTLADAIGHDERIGRQVPAAPDSASAAAACPRTSARSWPGPASWASTRR